MLQFGHSVIRFVPALAQVLIQVHIAKENFPDPGFLTILTSFRSF